MAQRTQSNGGGKTNGYGFRRDHLVRPLEQAVNNMPKEKDNYGRLVTIYRATKRKK